MLNKNKIIVGAATMSMVMGVVSPQIVHAEVNKGFEYVNGNSGSLAQDSNGRTWRYADLKNGTIEIFGTNDTASYIEVPATLDGKTVTAIDHIIGIQRNFKQTSNNQKLTAVTKIKLPQNVKVIGDTAFWGCTSLTDIEMPEDVEMSESIFEFCPNIKVNGKENNNHVSSEAHDLTTGWKQIGNNKYYINLDGELQTGWMSFKNNKYYFYGDGHMATGFINLGDDAVYYLDPTEGDNKGNLVTGWKTIDNKLCYFHPEGKDGKEKGFMQKGWLFINGGWHYFYGNGQMATGFINLGGGADFEYYFDESGSELGTMRTGWQKIGDFWYYFNKEGDQGSIGRMQVGWKYIDGNWYYFYYGNGKMVQNKYIDGYWVGSDGKLQR